jgi:hypothetical protein
VGVADEVNCALAGAGDADRTGGVPNRGGVVPIELDNAAARAETPGPAKFDPAPASGVNWLGKLSSPRAGGEEIPEMGGVPNKWDGMGEAKRAVDSARGTDAPPNIRPRIEPGDEDIGISKGSRGGAALSSSFDIFGRVQGWLMF